MKYLSVLSARVVLVGAIVVSTSCASKIDFKDRPSSIEVLVTEASKVPTREDPIPITFDPSQATTFKLTLTMRNQDGSARASFTGPNAWVRLTVEPNGIIVAAKGPKGETDPDVVNGNVHLTNGRIEGVEIRVIGAYGDSRIVAEDKGFTPGSVGKANACSDGIDNDNDGLADFPLDPKCLFLNDNSEASFDAARGVSQPLFFAYPRIWDVQVGATSNFFAKQVAFPGDRNRMIVTNVSNDGMYVTDIDDDGRLNNSIFVYNFGPPFGIKNCDRLTRLSGNVADFNGMTQLSTPGWEVLPWLNTELSGPCLVPKYKEVSDAIAAITPKMDPLVASLINVKNPTIGVNFGPLVAPGGVPGPGASNCDLNSDGTVGFQSTKGGFRPDEKACNDACSADPDCTEWNNFRSFGQVKINFGAGKGTLFLSPGAVPTFDPRKFLGAGKLLEVRGAMTKFIGPTPPYAIEPRCEDDIIIADSDRDKDGIQDKDDACPGIKGVANAAKQFNGCPADRPEAYLTPDCTKPRIGIDIGDTR